MACSALAGPLDEQAATEALDSVLGPLYEVGLLLHMFAANSLSAISKSGAGECTMQVHAKHPSNRDRPGQGLYRLAHAFQSRQNKFQKIQFWGIYLNHEYGKPHAVQYTFSGHKLPFAWHTQPNVCYANSVVESKVPT